MDAMRERRQVGQSLLLQPSRSGRVAAAEAGRAGKRARARRAALSSASKAREMRILEALKERRDAAIYGVLVRIPPYLDASDVTWCVAKQQWRRQQAKKLPTFLGAVKKKKKSWKILLGRNETTGLQLRSEKVFPKRSRRSVL